MNAEETKVLTTLIDIAEDIKDGALPAKTVMLMLAEMLPDLLELQRYIGALETSLYKAQQNLDEAQYYCEESYNDYSWLADAFEMLKEEYEEED